MVNRQNKIYIIFSEIYIIPMLSLEILRQHNVNQTITNIISAQPSNWQIFICKKIRIFKVNQMLCQNQAPSLS
jgi:hypothetical protein